MQISRTLTALLAAVFFCAVVTRAAVPPSPIPREYADVQKSLAKGWNTWDTHNMLSHVLLPDGLSINVVIDRGALFDNSFLSRALVRQSDVKVLPGPHRIDGSYTELELVYGGLKVRVQSATEGEDLLLLVTPLERSATPALPVVVFQAGAVWNSNIQLTKTGDRIDARLASGRVVPIAVTGKPELNTEVIGYGAYLAVPLEGPAGLSTGRARKLAEIQDVIKEGRARYEARIAAFGDAAQLADAIETVLGWDTIYDPERQRVFSPVSRNWNENFGGYVLFDWDSYFAAYMAGLLDRDLAYANAVEITQSLTPGGFVPNFARARGWDSYDRSEPPVGSITILALYQKFGDAWLLRDAFPNLLRWNRWWAEHRDNQGYLAWGSDPSDAPWERADKTVNTAQGARYESGLDNSPMYDDVPYDAQRHVMDFADVGLMSLYIADCRALATIADELSRAQDAAELRSRADRYQTALQTLWDEPSGVFRNKNLRTGKLDKRLSPTNFYPLLAGVPAKQAERMVKEHLLNPQEFWGEWVIPSSPRDDPAFQEQNYWRGRIWGPMNFLVYLGLRNYDLPQARAQLVEKSRALFLKEWQANRHVHENYNSILGTGDDVTSSDPFYHWGALLMLMDAMERGKYGKTTP